MPEEAQDEREMELTAAIAEAWELDAAHRSVREWDKGPAPSDEEYAARERVLARWRERFGTRFLY